MYEKIINIFKTKQNILFTRNDGQFIVMSNLLDSDGNFITNGWYGSKEVAKEHIGYWGGYTKEGIERYPKEDNWKIVEVFDFPKPTFNGVDKLMVLPNAKEECLKYEWGWNKEREDMIGGIYDVLYANKDWFNIGNGVDGRVFPTSCLSYPFESPKEEESEKIKKAKELLECEGYKISKE